MKYNTLYLLIFSLAYLSACRSNNFEESNSATSENDISEKNYNWYQDKTKLIFSKGNSILWQLNYNQKEDKPYFHPINSPNGILLTLERPDDHPWHRGLWFSWKTVNGVNYWEEDPEKGVSEGRSRIESVDVKQNSDHSTTIKFQISYEVNGDQCLSENRILNISPIIDSSYYTIQWEMSFLAKKEVLLDLEKPAKHGGVAWGGYAGMSYRASNDLKNVQISTSTGWSNTKALTGHGEEAIWMDITANTEDSKDKFAGLTILDHPKNPRYPSPWYVWFTPEKNIFFTPSFLFDGPITLGQNEKLYLKYLNVIHDGELSEYTIDKVLQDFTTNK